MKRTLGRLVVMFLVALTIALAYTTRAQGEQLCDPGEGGPSGYTQISAEEALATLQSRRELIRAVVIGNLDLQQLRHLEQSDQPVPEITIQDSIFRGRVFSLASGQRPWLILSALTIRDTRFCDAVTLPNLGVTGQVVIRGSRFHDDLHLEWLTVGGPGGMALSDSVFAGLASFHHMESRQITCDRCQFIQDVLFKAVKVGSAIFSNVILPMRATMSWTNAEVDKLDLTGADLLGVLELTNANLGSIDLVGTVYGELRVTWQDLKSTTFLPSNVPQKRQVVYERLADNFRQLGQDEDAFQAAFLAGLSRRAQLSGTAYVWQTIMLYLNGFGYRPWRALAWFGSLWLVFSVAYMFPAGVTLRRKWREPNDPIFRVTSSLSDRSGRIMTAFLFSLWCLTKVSLEGAFETTNPRVALWAMIERSLGVVLLVNLLYTLSQTTPFFEGLLRGIF